VVLLVALLAAAFWESRIVVFAVASLIFFGGASVWDWAFPSFPRPSNLFVGSLDELRRDNRSPEAGTAAMNPRAWNWPPGGGNCGPDRRPSGMIWPGYPGRCAIPWIWADQGAKGLHWLQTIRAR
jgi:hypothetical protein